MFCSFVGSKSIAGVAIFLKGSFACCVTLTLFGLSDFRVLFFHRISHKKWKRRFGVLLRMSESGCKRKAPALGSDDFDRRYLNEAIRSFGCDINLRRVGVIAVMVRDGWDIRMMYNEQDKLIRRANGTLDDSLPEEIEPKHAAILLKAVMFVQARYLLNLDRIDQRVSMEVMNEFGREAFLFESDAISIDCRSEVTIVLKRVLKGRAHLTDTYVLRQVYGIHNLVTMVHNIDKLLLPLAGVNKDTLTILRGMARYAKLNSISTIDENFDFKEVFRTLSEEAFGDKST